MGPESVKHETGCRQHVLILKKFHPFLLARICFGNLSLQYNTANIFFSITFTIISTIFREPESQYYARLIVYFSYRNFHPEFGFLIKLVIMLCMRKSERRCNCLNMNMFNELK